MSYMTASGLDSEVRNELARTKLGYTGPFEDTPGNPNSEWAKYRLDPAIQSKWVDILENHKGIK